MKKILIASLLAIVAFPLHAQKDRTPSIITSYLHGWEYAVRAGFNIGGTAPVPLPEEIRSIDGYKPGVGISIEGRATKWFSEKKKWGLTLGFRLENRSMETKATTKNYGMEILNAEGGKLAGLWTGGVQTKVKNAYLTVPVLMNYRFNSRWQVSMGTYLSYLTDGNFSGYVYDGHLRTPDEGGARVDFSEGNTATYDFSGELRHFQWGLQAGAEWRAFKHLTVHADLSWGLNDIFKKDFQTIDFSMYSIYLNLGFGYAF
ncbi:MAG: PorT family protein [Bacteroides sp.]|nr:PorT family protein [Bacteroides sp.]